MGFVVNAITADEGTRYHGYGSDYGYGYGYGYGYAYGQDREAESRPNDPPEALGDQSAVAWQPIVDVRAEQPSVDNAHSGVRPDESDVAGPIIPRQAAVDSPRSPSPTPPRRRAA
jgi:hypothetical protein